MSEPPRSLRLLEEVMRMVPKENKRLRNYLAALRESLEEEGEAAQKTREQIAEYQAAYEKLTSPANRVGVFLQMLEEGIALIALGETEFVAGVDPNLNISELLAGTRVKLNDAYAVVGVLPPDPGGKVVKVSDVLEDGQLLVSQDPSGNMRRVVLRGAAIADAGIKAGDEVRIESNFKVALEHYPQSGTREYFFEEVQEITWDQIGGQEEAIELIRNTIEYPLLHPEIFAKFDKKPIKGVLLYGPPGCGKTLIGKATAHNVAKEYSKVLGREVKEYFMYISGPKILNMWLGETERMVREIFQTAREHAKDGRLVFIFFDEAESVLRTRTSGRWFNISNTVVPQFCAELDGLVGLENVVLMLTSNRPDYIDPAILRPERIDRKVKIKRPDKEATRRIFEIYLKESLPYDPEALAADGGDKAALRSCLIDTITSYLWRTSPETEFVRVYFRNGGSATLYWKDLVSGALIKSVVDRAKDKAIKRAIGDRRREHGISLQDLEEAVREEYEENEIFPKSDSQEDWLKLLDFDEENVVAVRSIRKGDIRTRPVI